MMKISPVRLPQKQRGAALLLLLLVAVTLGLTFLFRPTDLATENLSRSQRTQEALAQAKAALIAWSVLQGDIGSGLNPRPGTLPCPDTTNSGTQSGACSAGGGTTIGRLPWRTLGIPNPVDANGDTLWYAVSSSFRNTSLNNNAINSDTQGTLLLYAADGVTLLTPAGEELSAVIFSPGTPLPGQNRAAGPNLASNFLDNGNGRNNGNAAGPFITGLATDVGGNLVINDQVLGISAKELIAALEKRVLKEAQIGLEAFALANLSKYPNPGAITGPNCTGTITNVATPTICASDITTCFGRLPEDSLGPYAAAWFQQNGWGRVLTYAVNQNDATNPTGANCSPSLISGSVPMKYVIIAPGTPRNGQVRPSSVLSDYLEDASNNDAWGGDPTFSAPSTTSNDQMRSRP